MCSLVACNDWLDVESKVVLSEEDIAQYPELVETQFLSNYDDLRGNVQAIGDGALSYRQHHLSSFTDDAANNTSWTAGIMSSNNSPGWIFSGIFSQTKGESFTQVWCYKEINKVNKFIRQNVESPLDGIQQIVGEAFFIRAFLYFEMVKRYGGVPLFAGSLDNVTSINQRATEEASWLFILGTLDSAIARLPPTQNVLAEDRDRANRHTALALKSRAMLYAGTIAKYGTVTNNGLQGIRADAAREFLLEAAEAAKQVVESQKYTLSANFEDLFNGKDENNNEIIFRFSNVTKTGRQVFHDYWNQPYKVKHASYTAFMSPTIEIVEQFERLDGTIQALNYSAEYTDAAEFFAGRDKRLAATIIYPGGEFMGERYSIYRETRVKTASSTTTHRYNSSDDWKQAAKVPGHEAYMQSGIDGIFNNTAGDGITNYGFYLKKALYGIKRLEDYLSWENDQDAVIIRYGEVILNLAEAAVELNSYGNGSYLGVAQTAFDELRSTHGGLPPKTLTLAVARHERRIDLLYEGFRYWDQKRWRIGTNMHNLQLQSLHPILNIDETVSPARVYYTIEQAPAPDYLNTRTKWFQERDYYCPLPTSQSPGITQNSGW
ncbi:glycan metabolism protein RagB [Bacteroidia bacterium]|nr:glycan metabolism protein RagB [Bacteroidia bacterium]